MCIEVGDTLPFVETDSEINVTQSTNRSVLGASTTQNKAKKHGCYSSISTLTDDDVIGDIFNYQNNCVKIKCMFTTLKDLFQS